MKRLYWPAILAGLLLLLTGCGSPPQSNLTLPLAQDRLTFFYFYTDG